MRDSDIDKYLDGDIDDTTRSRGVKLQVRDVTRRFYNHAFVARVCVRCSCVRARNNHFVAPKGRRERQVDKRAGGGGKEDPDRKHTINLLLTRTALG